MAACAGISQAVSLKAVPSPSSRTSSQVASSRQTLACSGSAFVGQRAGFEVSVGKAERAFRGLNVRCGKGFIPGEDRWMYEGIEQLGPDVWNRTYYPKAAEHLNVEKQWFVVDASNMRLGRMAATIAIHIRGKHLPTFTPSVDMGAYVVVVNAEKVGVTGNKRWQKLYRRHSGRPGGMKEETFDKLQARIPERIVEKAVKGMLPKGSLGRELFTHLKVYKGPEHPHAAQKPEALPIHDKRIMMP